MFEETWVIEIVDGPGAQQRTLKGSKLDAQRYASFWFSGEEREDHYWRTYTLAEWVNMNSLSFSEIAKCLK